MSTSSSNSAWHEIQLRCPDTDEAAAICHALGAALIETLSENSVRVFFEGEPRAFIALLPKELIVLNTQQVENKNWHESCPELWAPKLIGELTITPITGVENPPKRNKNELLIIPGTGFGTGHHPATAMLIARLQGITPAPSTILDLGCGSGILAIVARHVWPSATIDAIDNDPLALENAEDNLKINEISDISLICGTLENAPLSSYNLLIANLYCSLLIQLQPLLRARCKRLILSGVMESEQETLCAAFKDWTLQSSQIVDGWFSAEFS